MLFTPAQTTKRIKIEPLISIQLFGHKPAYMPGGTLRCDYQVDAVDISATALARGEEAYAALLYATGRPNSVVVTDVLESSPARDAGLEPGDEILRYASERLFRPNELRLATAAGEPNEFVSIEVRRDGRPVTLQVRRGPLGVLLQGATRPPPP